MNHVLFESFLQFTLASSKKQANEFRKKNHAQQRRNSFTRWAVAAERKKQEAIRARAENKLPDIYRVDESEKKQERRIIFHSAHSECRFAKTIC
ncbi:MAG: hypothetical protein HY064_03535 [Bacteroidetes bacterium]|nr:hypothetical protein [Bacteroidota bacterium]